VVIRAIRGGTFGSGSAGLGLLRFLGCSAEAYANHFLCAFIVDTERQNN
jgi:hypothetical protein